MPSARFRALPALHGELFPAAVQSFLWFIFIPFQQHPGPAISKPSPFRRDLFHCFPDILVIRWAFALDSLWIDAGQGSLRCESPRGIAQSTASRL
ncbi:MAG: hypothetical protein HRT36_08540 [Alphaproteobacteria bacterium]|nr:hypothetical protein [Alphaproteobacteria bacterium]